MNEIRGTRQVPRWLIGTGTTVSLFFLVALIVLRDWTHLLAWLAWSVYMVVLTYRRAVRVTATAVHVPGLPRWLPAVGRRRQRLSWDQIAAVERPGPFSEIVMLRHVDGSVVPLPGIPAARSGEVAELGGKELQSSPKSSSRIASVNKPEARRPSEAEVERDLRKREAALAAEGKRLVVELERIRRRRAGD